MSLPTPRAHHVALVTGASSGIGAEIARELAARGHDLVLVARSADRLESLAEQLRVLGREVHVLPADLGDRAARAALLPQLEDRGLTTQVLVNNAGYSTLGAVHKAEPAGEVDMLEVDVVAVADLCTRFLPGMVERGEGAVLNVASTAAFQPLPGQAAYGAAKAFVLSYTRSIAAELHGTGVHVTALCPGPVKTGFEEAAGFDDGDIDQTLPSIMWVPAPEVAKAAVDGLAKGAAVVIPGLANRAGAAFATVLPKRLLASVLAKGHPGLR